MQSRSYGRSETALALLLLVASLLPVEPACGQAHFVRGYARAAMTYGGGIIFSDDDADGAPLSERAVTGSAFQINGGSASFNIDPEAGAGAVLGYSVPITYEKYIVNLLGSHVEASMVLMDSFTIEGDSNIQDGHINVNYSGALFPNTDFESHFPNFSSVRITFDMTTGWLNAQGNFEGGGEKYPTQSFESRGGLEGFEDVAQEKFFVTDNVRTYGVEIVIGGLGINGGGFSLNGSGGVTPQASFSNDSAAVEAARVLKNSFFEITVSLPPGLSISGHSPFIRQVTVPESATLALVSIGFGLVGAMSRRRNRGNTVVG